MPQYFEGIMSKHQCGFRKGHRAQHASISLLEKWRTNVDQGPMSGALFTDLKVFDFLSHDIIIAKLKLYVVPQGLILGPLVFNVVLCILFVSHIEL